MPVYKGKDGKFYESKSPPAQIGKDQRTLASSAGSPNKMASSDDRTRLGGETSGPPQSPETPDAFNQKTRLAGAGPAGQSTNPPPAQSDDATGRWDAQGGGPANAASPKGPGTAANTSLIGSDPAKAAVAPDATVSPDPVAGWLVIEKGPGKGFALQVGIGMNSVGRGPDQRIQLNYGDQTISSKKHCFVSYDPRSRQFGIHMGDGPNITYLNRAPIYGSETLQNMAQIEVGLTTLRFVAFCGEGFSWDD